MSAIDVTFSEAMGVGDTLPSNYEVSGVGAGTLPMNPTGVAWQSGTTYRLTWTSGEMKTGSDITVTVSNIEYLAGGFINCLDNMADAGGGLGAAPTISMSSTTASLTNVVSIPVTVTFNEPVSGFTLDDITSSNGTPSDLEGGPLAFTFNLTPIAQGAVTANIGAGVSVDLANNDNTAALQFMRTFDSVAPTVLTLETPAPDPTNVSPIPVTVTFIEPVIGFHGEDVTTSNATVNEFAGSGGVYTFNLVPSSQGVVAASISAGACTDAAGNSNTSSETLSLEYNSTRPTVSLTSTASGLTNASLISVMATFSSDVTGFELSDISTSNCSKSNLVQVTAKVYTFDLSMSAQGEVTATVPENICIDAATNGNQAGSFSITYDNVSPTVVEFSSTAPNPTRFAIPVTIRFSESVSGFTIDDITAVNGTVSNLAGGPLEYTFDLSPTDQGEATVTVNVGVCTDEAGNPNMASTPLSRDYDNEYPTVVEFSSTAPNLTRFAIPVTIRFSESVSGFTIDDITAVNGTVSNLAGGPLEYTFDLSPTDQGEATVTVNAGVCTDEAGNLNAASTPLSRDYDSNRPTVLEFSSTLSNPTRFTPIPVIIVFGESVTGFTIEDINAVNGTAGNFTGGPLEYRFNLTPSGQGLVTANIASESYSDVAGNTNTATSQFSITYDSVLPTAPFVTGVTHTNDTTPTWSWTTGGGGNGTFRYQLGGTAAGAWTETVNTNFTPVSALSEAVYRLHVQERDDARNWSADSIFDIFVDVTPPSVAIGAPSSSSTESGPVTYTVTYTGASTVTLANGNVTLNTSGTAMGTKGVSGTGNTTRTVTLSGISGDGSLGISIAANTASDAAGNSAPAAGPSATFTVDNSAPDVQSIELSFEKMLTIDYIVTFTEPVTGVDVADFDLTTTGDVTGESIVSVSGSGAVYTVTVNPGTGIGTIRLDVVDDNSILDSIGHTLGGPDSGDGGYTAGPVFDTETIANLPLNITTALVFAGVIMLLAANARRRRARTAAHRN